MRTAKLSTDETRAMLSNLHTRCIQGEVSPLLATVSGVISTKPSLIQYVDTDLPAFGLITTKSFQLHPNTGNREPILCEIEPGSFGNSVGLRNPGIEIALKDLISLRKRHSFRSLLNVSVSASSIDDFITLVGLCEEVADIIELNFSCPHAQAGYGSSIGCSIELSSRYMSEIRRTFPHCKALIFPKLTPNVSDIAPIARSLLEQGADGLVAINTVGPEVHLDATSGKPILQNALGGKGGKSGNWIYEIALSAIKTIRGAIGEEIPLIGMGGVSTGTQLAEMITSGADVVGVGSAFAKVTQEDWRAYSDALVSDATAILQGNSAPSTAEAFYKKELSMTYERYEVVHQQYCGNDTVVLTANGSYPFDAGQFVFIWLPGIGEKPFSIAHANPLQFVIKRRGVVSEALYNLTPKDEFYVRGLYGAPAEIDPNPKALLIAGGTGVAVLPALAQRLQKQGVEISIMVGTSEIIEGKYIFEDLLAQCGSCISVADDGIPARVLQHLDKEIEDLEHTSCYLVGPQKFMSIAAQKLIAKGVLKHHIHLSLELQTMCGVGLCGECACGSHLTCQWGTFMNFAYIEKEAPELL